MNFFKMLLWTFVIFLPIGSLTAQVLKVRTFEKSFVLKDEDGKNLEPSAVEPIGDKYLLIADDKGASLYIVETATKKVVHSLKIGDVKKPKWEAMAFDGKFFYIIGSHAVKLDNKDTPAELAEKLAARSHLLRFELEKTNSANPKEIKIKSFTELNVSESLKTAGLYNADPFKNKVKIEGLAVRQDASKQTHLIFALREPSDLMHVYSAKLPDKPKADDKLSLEPLFDFEAGKIGAIPFRLSSIEYVSQWNGFFMLTSTEDPETNAFSGNALWFISDEAVKNAGSSKKVSPQNVSRFADNMKAEGLCVMPGITKNRLRLMIAFDNDFDDTGKAGEMQIMEIEKK